MWPAMRIPFSTRPGLVPAPMEPGARWRSDWPWVLGPPRKPWRFTTPAKPRPLDDPAHVYQVARLEDLAPTFWPTRHWLMSSTENSRR